MDSPDLLDAGFGELSLRLGSRSGRGYAVHLEALWWQSLNEGLMQWRSDEPEFLREITQESLQRCTERLLTLWPTRTRWTLVTPLPDYEAPRTCRRDVILGRLCAGVLCSRDDHFPGLDAPDTDHYFSEANLVWVTRKGEGILPGRVRALIDWEEVAAPAG